jgi:hypothetical protein
VNYIVSSSIDGADIFGKIIPVIKPKYQPDLVGLAKWTEEIDQVCDQRGCILQEHFPVDLDYAHFEPIFING